MTGALARAYCGPAGLAETFYVAELDCWQQPVTRLSGVFLTRVEAVATLRWLRQRNPRARLVCDRLSRSIED